MSNSEATTGAKLAGTGAPVPTKAPTDPGSKPLVSPPPFRRTGESAAPGTAGRRATRANTIGGLHAALATPGGAPLTRLGRYQVVGRIATGGMAEVYLAVHGELAGFRTPVVIKKVLPHLACNPEFIDMFLDEARIASLLDHPNVVRIYEVGRSDSEYFLAMELVQGKPLQALLRRAQETRAAVLEPRLAAFIVAQAASGLHHAHNLTDPLGNTLGLVHRDVSPQNVLLSFEGSVKVIDFGVARALGRITETQTGGMKGKFGYMSPEQARGEDLDLRADIFALGVVLWESVTGRRLFQRDNDLATMRALIYDPIPKPSTVLAVAEGLESIIMRALTREPAHRFQTARDLANALERFIVQSGGASASDLGAVMKSHFAQDYGTWQQTLRTVINLPAHDPEAPTTSSPAPAASGVNPRSRPPLLQRLTRKRLAIAAGAAAALALLLVLLLGGGKDRPATSQPSAPALAAPTIEPPSLPAPPRETVGPDEDPPPAAAKPPAAGVSRARRKNPPATRTTSSKGPTNRSDRRPNPF
jgi:eukaryotic-like serine/threonine-protein kinase